MTEANQTVPSNAREDMGVLALNSDTNTASYRFELKNDRSAFGDENSGTRILVPIETDIIDTLQGRSVSYEVYGSKVSRDFLRLRLNKLSTRTKLSEFFDSRKFAVILEGLIPVRSLFPNQAELTKEMLIDALVKSEGAEVGSAVAELVMPLMLHLGLVTGSRKFSDHYRYPFKPVTVDDIRADVQAYEVLTAAKATVSARIDPKIKYGRHVLARDIAEALRPIAASLREMSEMAPIIDDMIRCVRAHVDPANLSGSVTGHVQSLWRNHRAVEELARNYIFLSAALSLPKGADLTLSCSDMVLDKWISLVLATIKSSERYKWVSKTESRQAYGTRRIRDAIGKPVCAVLSRAMRLAPVAQVVYMSDDALMKGGVTLSAPRDRIADNIGAAYGTLSLDTDRAADALATMLEQAIENGWKGYSALYVVDEQPVDMNKFAALTADKVYAVVGSEGVSSASETEVRIAKRREGEDESFYGAWQPNWCFSLATKERNLDLTSGMLYLGAVTTFDPIEVLLAAEDIAVKAPDAPRDQLLGPESFGPVVVNFDKNLVRSMNKRFPFSIRVNGVHIHGAFDATDLSTMKTSHVYNLVKPHYNQAVASTYHIAVLQLAHIANELTQSIAANVAGDWAHGVVPPASLPERFTRRVCREALNAASQLSPSFRNEIHQAIVNRAIVGKTTEEAIMMRAKFAQTTFGAIADVIALQFLFAMQGIDSSSFSNDIVLSEEAIRVYGEVGTNRYDVQV